MRYIILLCSLISANVFAACAVNTTCVSDNVILEFTNIAKVAHVHCYIRASYGNGAKVTSYVTADKNVEFDRLVVWNVGHGGTDISLDAIQKVPGTLSTIRIDKVFGKGPNEVNCSV